MFRQPAIRNSFILALACIIFCSAQAIAQDHGKLVFAVDVIRHGDRAPITDLPVAPHKWPQGLGQLTPEGMHQEFELGKEFRKRYIEQNHLLPEMYDCETMYVRASDVDRTLMSAECALLGLYPLGQGPLTEAGADGVPARYQPIPIHTRPRETDDVLVPDANKEVPDVYRRYVYESPEWKAQLAKEGPNFERWSKLTGMPISKLQQVTMVGDAFFIRQIHHVPLPQGVTQADADAMSKLGEWAYAQTFKPAEVGQVTGIKLLRLIDKHIDDVTSGSSKLKYVLFSAHDSTISSLLSAMKAPANVRPHYSSDLNIQLWRDGSSYSVRVALNGEPVNFPGSVNGASPLEKFEELLPAAL